jgi:hypothetical protein
VGLADVHWPCELKLGKHSSFPTLHEAQDAFSAFDRDDNGDATRDEIEMACMQLHREKMSLEASMKDLDGAVRRLDDVSNAGLRALSDHWTDEGPTTRSSWCLCL